MDIYPEGWPSISGVFWIKKTCASAQAGANELYSVSNSNSHQSIPLGFKLYQWETQFIYG